MRFCRFQSAEGPRYGRIDAVAGRDCIIEIIAPPFPPAGVEPAQPLPRPLPVEYAQLLVPVEPSKIVCIGRNYREHAKELEHEIPTEPMFFLKPPSSLLAHAGVIRCPRESQRVDHEGELALVIARTCSRLAEGEDVRPFILGYTCLNDVTARDLQPKSGPWTRAKGFDTFCPVGPLVSDGLDPWAGVAVETRVNGQVRQQGNTRDFLFPLDAIIRAISRVMTLLPGDLVATGTPAGVGPLQTGDTVEVSVEGVGTLRNTVMDE
ncbi:MAG TPA: fumarylacetoacetate hydrolase family protein [Terriglobales bacterium]|nr:fumarylacetoacetate hydrolase family protein [Terriglobales bacterium]